MARDQELDNPQLLSKGRVPHPGVASDTSVVSSDAVKCDDGDVPWAQVAKKLDLGELIMMDIVNMANDCPTKDMSSDREAGWSQRWKTK